MQKIKTLKIDPSSIAGIADAIKAAIGGGPGPNPGGTTEEPPNTIKPKDFDSSLIIGKNKDELRPSGTFGNNIFADTDNSKFSTFKTTPGKQYSSVYAKAIKSLHNLNTTFKNNVNNDKVKSFSKLKKYSSVWKAGNTLEDEKTRVIDKMNKIGKNDSQYKTLQNYLAAINSIQKQQDDKRLSARIDYIKTHISYYESLKSDVKKFMNSKDYKKYGISNNGAYADILRGDTIKKITERLNKAGNLSSKEQTIYDQIKAIYEGLSNPARTLQSYLTQMEGTSNWGPAMDKVNSSSKDEKKKWNKNDHPEAAYFPRIKEIGTAIKGKAAFFDTGGYTGEFDGGKVAVLHEKEIVLNKEDTKNMLQAVQIVREIPKLAAAIPNMSSSTTSSNQNITINASFPNASSSDEIKKALESLSSKALQYQYRTKSY
jgi:hypothetical protein